MHIPALRKKMVSAGFFNGYLEEKQAPDATRALGSSTEDALARSGLSLPEDYVSWEGLSDKLDTLISSTYTATDDFIESYKPQLLELSS